MVVAAINLALGPEMPLHWAPEGVRGAPERFVITTVPAGARVVLDDDPVPGVTPAEVELVPGYQYNLRVQLGGYKPARLAFTLAGLSESQREERTLHFPLALSSPPGRIVINKAPYPVRGDGSQSQRGRPNEIRPQQKSQYRAPARNL